MVWQLPLSLWELLEVRSRGLSHTEFLQVVGQLFKQAERQASPESGLKLTEVELSVQISGEGEIKLVAGAKAAAAGAIKLKFTRSDAQGS